MFYNRQAKRDSPNTKLGEEVLREEQAKHNGLGHGQYEKNERSLCGCASGQFQMISASVSFDRERCLQNNQQHEANGKLEEEHFREEQAEPIEPDGEDRQYEKTNKFMKSIRRQNGKDPKALCNRALRRCQKITESLPFEQEQCIRNIQEYEAKVHQLQMDIRGHELVIQQLKSQIIEVGRPNRILDEELQERKLDIETCQDQELRMSEFIEEEKRNMTQFDDDRKETEDLMNLLQKELERLTTEDEKEEPKEIHKRRKYEDDEGPDAKRKPDA
ncbi:uncharacterized protein CELE_F14H3.3 [Caenorhabditis elegans]|uniref:Uncharacterized protein n=1 Tax=Caenorhabditis elegans TaxID=6239 RepID=O45362_CAEEL|nr:Uncharacterized protein CELE_F14H3.3 [Caenorhabditis elegans]CAB05482.2 Uncharacterized protein CELE_F14H3.3 [Caenorhabditis elegans]|eukprot:NP_507037.1 Uncharacterized protein CELE_F14H3.3 [Caenorhabditis elegans]